MSVTTERALRSLLGESDREPLREIFGARVRFDEPLAPFTSWKIGGPADALANVQTEAELEQLLRFCLRRRMPWWIIGAGSNVLVGDGGVRGVVVRLGGDFAAVRVCSEEGRVVVEAGGSADMALVTAKAASAGADGIGSLAGIPGTIGGSLRMNAGTDREIGEFVREVWVQAPSRPQPHAASVQYLYRQSTLERDVVVSRVVLAFANSSAGDVRSEMQTRLVRRKKTQPIALPNAGSCFRNPPSAAAARLIEDAGAKGWREGGAEVSRLHANFINNLGGATARDVATLLARVRRAVRDHSNVELQLEVHLVGVFIDAT
ncbi:MAG TPA: UDP-N-acetylmuramate dehydrogenase [Candidatus Cybelea sp.]|jgi:UDP-N-acetylmuramate dehydrogenase|nr:UDP-N-acetylmuramate dehydrogenase [Candidatus Cybelea sp.]